jgi:hypothetical protein
LEEKGEINPYQVIVKGLSDCGCGVPFRHGIAMDIFAGSRTLAVASEKLHRQAVLIEISEEYCQLAV